MAHVFSAYCSLLWVCLGIIDSKVKRAGGRAVELQLAPPCGRLRTAQGGVWGDELFTFQGRAWRSEAMDFKFLATSRLRTKGFNRIFFWSNRRLVCGCTSTLANTRARGVCASS